MRGHGRGASDASAKSAIQNDDVAAARLRTARFTAAEGHQAEIATRGVHALPKEPTAVIAAGAEFASDAAATPIDPPDTGLYAVGIPTEPAGNGVTTLQLQPGGIAAAAVLYSRTLWATVTCP